VRGYEERSVGRVDPKSVYVDRARVLDHSGTVRRFVRVAAAS
jgi:hypothetical protein